MNSLDLSILESLGLSKESAQIVMQEISTLRTQRNTLKRRVTWFLSMTEGMFASEQVRAILDEIE